MTKYVSVVFAMEIKCNLKDVKRLRNLKEIQN